jgi:Ca2+-binding EF-hand superfamily protein
MNRDHPNFESLLAQADQQAIDEFFAIGDKDQDGSLSQDEFRAVAKMLGYVDMINQFFP